MQRLAVLQRRTITARLPSGRPARRAMSTHYQLWIDGRAVDAADGATLPIEDPSTGIAFATTALAGVSDVDAAVEAALRCHTTGAWRSKGAAGRGKVLRKAADLLRADLPSLVETEVRSTGRPVREFEAQLARVPEWLEYHASVAETAEGTIPRFGDAQDHLAIVRRRPLGVCGLITPWNHPLLIAVKKVSVALASANTVVLKAPELAPGSVLRLAEIITEAGAPPGAMNVVTGLGSVAGAALARHPSVSRIDFTGGNGAGRAIGAAAGAQLKSVCAELGGNCPVLVFGDTDLEEAVNGVAFGAFLASGQTCVSAKRILVHASIFDAFRERLVQKAESLVMGPPMERTTHVGPLASEAALQQVESQIARAVSEGASLLTGGGRPPLPLPSRQLWPLVRPDRDHQRASPLRLLPGRDLWPRCHAHPLRKPLFRCGRGRGGGARQRQRVRARRRRLDIRRATRAPRGRAASSRHHLGECAPPECARCPVGRLRRVGGGEGEWD